MDSSKIVTVGGIAMFGDFSPDGKLFFVPHQGDDQISVIDTATAKVVKTIPVPAASGCVNLHAFKTAPDGQSAVIVCEGDHLKKPGVAMMFSIPAQAITGAVTVGMFSDGAAWFPPAP